MPCTPPMDHPVLRGGTWNMRRDRRPAKARAYLRRMVRKHRLDFVCLQEAADYTGHLRRHPIPGYRLLMPSNDHGKRQTPILVRIGVRAQHVHVKQMSDDGWWTVHGDEHAPSSSVVALLAGWLRVASVHAPVSVSWPNGHPVGPQHRVAAYLSHTRRIVGAVRRSRTLNTRRAVTGAPVRRLLWVGDWNARTWEHGRGTPVNLAKRAGLTITEPKHRAGPGHDGIDYALSNARITHMRKHGTGGSDHPFVTFRVHAH